ncbi:hypothetical protein D3874_05465 [Oleomonas cavernae]|uniref:Uncharacterized protein n=1 Tax=Oleomonas cavernae TaxID=2320859 RepID=A0A418W948_9PROT|nr:hypothetical protein D3874_05465 [Oleomonas cavernae]
MVNADNFQVSGSSVGTPSVPATDVGGLAAASSATAAATQAAADAGARDSGGAASNMPSIITVEVVGYGGADCPNGTNPDGTCK